MEISLSTKYSNDRLLGIMKYVPFRWMASPSYYIRLKQEIMKYKFII